MGAVINSANDGLALRSVTVGDGSNKSFTPEWTELPIDGTPKNWRYLGGNAATVSSLDLSGRRLFFEAGSSLGMSLVAVDVDTAELLVRAPFSGELPLSSTGPSAISHF